MQTENETAAQRIERRTIPARLAAHKQITDLTTANERLSADLDTVSIKLVEAQAEVARLEALNTLTDSALMAEKRGYGLLIQKLAKRDAADFAEVGVGIQRTAWEQVAALAVEWGNARVDDGGGNALRNFAEEIRSRALNLSAPAAVRGAAILEYKGDDGKYLDAQGWSLSKDDSSDYVFVPIHLNGKVIALVISEDEDYKTEIDSACELLVSGSRPAAGVQVAPDAPKLSKAEARKILDLALELETTGRITSLSDDKEKSDMMMRNRAVQCALTDLLESLAEPALSTGVQVALTEKLMADMDTLRDEYASLSTALAFWLPNVPEEAGPIQDRIVHDVFFLGEHGEDKSAQDLGWIMLAAAPALSERAPSDEPLTRKQIAEYIDRPGFALDNFSLAEQRNLLASISELLAMSRGGSAPSSTSLGKEWIDENLHSYFSYSGNRDGIMWASVEDIHFFARAVEKESVTGIQSVRVIEAPSAGSVGDDVELGAMLMKLCEAHHDDWVAIVTEIIARIDSLLSAARKAVPGGLPRALEAVHAFLLGEGELEGCWYGDKLDTHRGHWWWRDNLRAAIAGQSGKDGGAK
jgi:hypothetical protein